MQIVYTYLLHTKMKLSERISRARLQSLINESGDDELLDDLYRLALDFEDAERNVERGPLKDLQKGANKFYRAGKVKDGRKIKYSGTVYICTNGSEKPEDTFECHSTHKPKKDQAVFEFKTVTKVVITPFRWSLDKYVTIEQPNKTDRK